ncbi:MAG: phage tail protein [Rhodocyclaceae bacterium]|nr:phage tail protein [Rhodocyclaceae bacterium]
MAGALVVAFTGFGETAATWASFAALDAGIMVGSEFAFGTVVGGLAGMAAGAALNAVAGSLIGGSSGNGQTAAAANSGLTQNISSTVEPIPVIYGLRKVAGTRVFVCTSGASNLYLWLVIVHGEGEIEGASPVWYFDDVLASDARFSPSGTPVYTLTLHTGSDTQAADADLIAALPDKWTAAHQLCGLSCTVSKLTYDHSAWSALPNVALVTTGRKLFDPRTSGTAYSNNAALVIRDYLTHPRYGRGLDAAQVDDASFSTAATQCDTLAYSINAVVDTSRTPFDNVQSLLAACRGWLVYTGGKYRLLLDRPWESGCFDFNEGNITGAWKFSQPGKKDKFNRVKASWINPDNNWQPDIVTVEDTALRASEDHGLVLESQIDLSTVTNQTQVLHLAMQIMKASRFGLSVQFRALPAGLRAEVGDVVTITHPTPGWSAKKFRVLKIVLRDDDEVEVTAQEYDDAVYTYDLPSLHPAGPATNLPNPFTLRAPGAPSVSETMYQTTGSAGVKTRATLSWAPCPDAWVAQYQVDLSAHGAEDWKLVTRTPAAVGAMDDVAPGVYDWRVRAIGNLGAMSPWAISTAEIYGLTAIPADVSGLTVVASNGHAMASWFLSPDLDVRIGGRIVIRHSPLTSGAGWADGYVLDDFAGDSVGALLPLITGTYMAKARDSSGNYSANAASFVATEALVSGWTTVSSIDQAPAWSGTKTNVVVVDGGLQLAGVVGATVAAGSYLFPSTLDFGTVGTRRVSAGIASFSFISGDTIDARAYVDDWASVDGVVVNDCDLTLYGRCTNDDPSGSPSWSGWAPFFVADFACRALQLRLDLVSADPVQNIIVTRCVITAKIPA